MRILVMRQGTTNGQSISDEQFRRLLISVRGMEVRSVKPAFARLPHRLRRQPIVDLAEAAAMSRALSAAERTDGESDVIVLPSATAALLLSRSQLRRAFVRFDALASENRLGIAGALSRLLERRAMRYIAGFMPYTRRAPAAGRRKSYLDGRVVLPFPTPVSSESGPPILKERDLAVAYCSDPVKKGLDFLLEAWSSVRLSGKRLVIAGISPSDLQQYSLRCGITLPANVSAAGHLSQSDYRALVRSARVYVATARYEDFGIAPLEAMSLGTVVVSGASEGPFEAKWILADVCPQFLVPLGQSTALADVIAAAMELRDAKYSELASRLQAAVAPYSEDALRQDLIDEIVPAFKRFVETSMRE